MFISHHSSVPTSFEATSVIDYQQGRDNWNNEGNALLRSLLGARPTSLGCAPCCFSTSSVKHARSQTQICRIFLENTSTSLHATSPPSSSLLLFVSLRGMSNCLSCVCQLSFSGASLPALPAIQMFCRRGYTCGLESGWL